MKANLHLHSRYSDGTLWPDEIVGRAAGLGLEAIALTDHDSMEGVAEFVGLSAKAGIKAYPAVEIDCQDGETKYKSEILGYFPRGAWKATAALLDKRLESRDRRIRGLIESASSRFSDRKINYEDFLRYKAGPRVDCPAPARFSSSKADLFNYLRLRKHLPKRLSYDGFKREYLQAGLIGSGIKEEHLGVREVIQAIRGDGGYAVLPHPGHEYYDLALVMKRKRDLFEALLDRFKAFGLSGVELYYYRSPGAKKINAIAAEAARARGLFLSCGSDCHGPGSQKDTMEKFALDFEGFPE